MTHPTESTIVIPVSFNVKEVLSSVVFYKARGLFRSRLGWLSALVGLMALGLSLPGCNGKSVAVTAIVINPENPNILFIATNDSIYKTRDDGATWVAINQGLGHARILSLAVHPIRTAIIYAGTLGDAVYRSMDGGNRWSIINAGLKEHVTVVNAFLFYPKDPETILAATTVGFFKTTDGGLMWEELHNKGLDSVYVVSAALDPNDTNILYGGTSGGVYKTINGGLSWSLVSSGMIEGEFRTAMALGVNSLAMDPNHSSTLYAGTTKGAFKTSDGAARWTKIQGGIGDRFIATILIHPKTNMTLYAGTQGGAYKTTDGSEHWIAINKGLTNLNIRSLAMHPKNPDILYAGTQGGLFKTLDGGSTWTALTLRPKG